MVSEVVTYYDGIEGKDVTKRLYFNLTGAEVSELGMDIEGGFEGLQDRVNNDFRGTFKEYYGIIKAIVVKAYGVKSKDGRTIIKPEEETLKFAASEAYSTIVKKLFEDETGNTLISFLEQVSDGAKKNNQNSKVVPMKKESEAAATVE